MHAEAGGSPYQLASATSNIWTNTLPTSRRTHASKTPLRNAPQPSGDTERSVTSYAVGHAVLAGRSTMGMSWMNSQPQSSRRNS